MLLAVKFWRDETVNDFNFPGDWPSQVIENVEENFEREHYELMTVEQYILYRSENYPLMEAWYAARSEE